MFLKVLNFVHSSFSFSITLLNKFRVELTSAVYSIGVINNLLVADSTRFKYEYSAAPSSPLINVQFIIIIISRRASRHIMPLMYTHIKV